MAVLPPDGGVLTYFVVLSIFAWVVGIIKCKVVEVHGFSFG